MWAKELWDARWRAPILNPIGWLLALSFPFLFSIVKLHAAHVPAAAAPLLHYPNMAFGWFGEDLPELLLLYVIIWSIAQITREWQTGTIEFLGQLPLTSGQIAWRKGTWGTAEIAALSLTSSAVLWIASQAGGHALPLATFVLSVALITMGFIAVLWLASLCAWALHSTYAVILLVLAFYIGSVITRSYHSLHRFSPLTYITNTNPAVHTTVLLAHLAEVTVAACLLALLAVRAAAKQEFISNHGRDQL